MHLKYIVIYIWIGISWGFHLYICVQRVTIILPVPKWSLSCCVSEGVYYGLIDIYLYVHIRVHRYIHIYIHHPFPYQNIVSCFILILRCLSFHSICKHLFSHSQWHELEANVQNSISDIIQRYKVGSTVGTHCFTDTKERYLLFEPSTRPSIKSQTEQPWNWELDSTILKQ